MNKFLEDIRKDKIIHYIIIAATCLIASIPLINLRIYGTDDGFVHMLRVFGVEQILKQGTFPPLIYSNFSSGFGYAINLFYAPLVTYGPLMFRLLGQSFSTCLKLFTFSTILISGFTMYNFLYEISKKREIAILGAVIYAFIPYRLETIYNRYAIGEFTAYMFFPMLFHGLYNLLKGNMKKHYYIAISAIGLILTHTISTEYSAIFAVLYLLLNIKCLKSKEIIKKLAINALFILLITSFFTVPLTEHKILGNYVIFNSTSMRSLPSDVQNSTIKILQLFKDTDEPEGVDFNLGMPLVILTILGIFTYRKIDKNIKNEYIFFLILALISLTMATRLFPWIIMPKILTTLQFAWRMLAFSEFAFTIICTINLYYFIEIISKKNEKVSNIIFIIAILLITVFMAKINYNYKYESKKTKTDEEYEQYMNDNEKISIWGINREYLPIKVDTSALDKSYTDYREDKVYILEGSTTITNENKQGLKLEFNIENLKANTVLELPYIYYLGYTVTIEQDKNIEKVQTFESDNGFISIKLDKDINNAYIKVEYTGTFAEKISYIISSVSIVAFAGYIIYNKKKLGE